MTNFLTALGLAAFVYVWDLHHQIKALEKQIDRLKIELNKRQ
jgi:uncharacterized small protein (DUF1192 family)